MSLLTPVKVPVKVYRWDDAGAPTLSQTAKSASNLITACLVTGYGSKVGAGWTMPFDNVAAGIKVLRPEVGTHTDFFLRLSDDTGIEVSTQVYLNMSSTSTGDLKLECNTPFKYGKLAVSNKWLLVATARGFWFFSEPSKANGDPLGVYLTVGDTVGGGTGERAVYLQHSGGTGVPAYSSITGVGNTSGTIDTSDNYYLRGKLLSGDIVSTVIPVSTFTGTGTTSGGILASPLVVKGGSAFVLAGLLASADHSKRNFDEVSLIASHSSDVLSAVNFGSSATALSNFYLATDFWGY